MKLTKDAKVYTSTNEEIGTIQRFVLDPKTKEINSLVIEIGNLLSRNDYVLPMEWVDHFDDEKIFLKALPVNLDELLPFEEEKFVVTDERALMNNEYIRADPGLRMYYYYPPATYSPFFGGPSGVPARVKDTSGMHKEYEENISESDIALEEGAKVWSQDSKHVGDVEKLFLDPKDQKITHLLISKGFLSKERKLVPVDWVENIYENRVNLSLNESTIDKLPEYHEETSK